MIFVVNVIYTNWTELKCTSNFEIHSGDTQNHNDGPDYILYGYPVLKVSNLLALFSYKRSPPVSGALRKHPLFTEFSFGHFHTHLFRPVSSTKIFPGDQVLFEELSSSTRGTLCLKIITDPFFNFVFKSSCWSGYTQNSGCWLCSASSRCCLIKLEQYNITQINIFLW